MLRILPQQFYQNRDVDKILVDGLSCVIHKIVHTPVLHKEGYVSTHAVTLVLKGTLVVENDSGAKAQVNENQMIFLPKGLYTISDILPENGTFESVIFFFDEEVISNFVHTNNITPKKEPCVAYKLMDYMPEVRVFTESLLQLYKKRSVATRQITKLKLYELLNLLSFARGSCLIEALATLNNKARKSLREFMELNYSKPLGIEDYAYLTGRSISSFRRDFIEQYNVSPKQWLIDKRLEKARQLLRLNNTTVSQVALEVGYENFSHFVKAFHKKYGVPPKQFLMRERKESMMV
jgi:AraC family transcriptional regulator, exoenzyme S synthesis regulatory protein ExsA